MGYYSDDEGQMNCVFSFENIGKIEAAKTLAALNEIEEQLAAKAVPSKVDASISPLGSVTRQESPFVHYRRMESNGYDAHSESVNEKEVLSWQSAFTYLSLKGERLSGNPVESEGTEECFLWTPSDCKPDNLASNSSTHDGNTVQDLVIIGKKCNVSEVMELSSEVDVSHGALVELIAVHSHVPSDAVDDVEAFDGDAISPRSSKRAEIVSLLLDALWPEVVEVLKPLVRRVVDVSKAEGLQYTTPSRTSEASEREYESENEDRMSVDDGYGSF
jgi:hypothetical protein